MSHQSRLFIYLIYFIHFELILDPVIRWSLILDPVILDLVFPSNPFTFRLTRCVAVRIVDLFIDYVTPSITQIQLSFIQWSR